MTERQPIQWEWFVVAAAGTLGVLPSTWYSNAPRKTTTQAEVAPATSNKIAAKNDRIPTPYVCIND